MSRSHDDDLRAKSHAAAFRSLVKQRVAYTDAASHRKRSGRTDVEDCDHDRAILDGLPDGILVIDPMGCIERANAAAAAMLGAGSGDLIGCDVDTLLPRLRDVALAKRSHCDVVNDLAKGGVFECGARLSDGNTRPIDVSLSTVDLPDGARTIVSLRDASERRRLDRHSRDLMSTVSHELRTPLTSVVGALGLLRGATAAQLPTAAARLVEISDNNAQRLIRLVNDLLLLDRAGAGTLPIERKSLDLRDVASRACRDMAAACQARIVCALPSTAVPVSGDAERLVQVLTNLLSNALRVTASGGEIVVGLRCADGEAMLTVDDDGPGIPLEFRRRIFGRFERAEGADDAGAGLGLAISRAIMDGHDGRIWFEDRPCGGARFIVALPICDGAERT